MTSTSIKTARGMRDAGIDAMAALHSVFPELLNALSEQDAQELKGAFSPVMAEIVDRLINPAVHAFPELQTDTAAWAAVVKERVEARLAMF
jgi:hypothetical protein